MYMQVSLVERLSHSLIRDFTALWAPRQQFLTRNHQIQSNSPVILAAIFTENQCDPVGLPSLL